ncbi:hypothetical protein DCAR_0832510 [Daucus carota subsp. sativus]|uniref:Uncharacterized protein n=1 Tax=Daucus carota subsp. sativus TaxID=79200 RepID=A0A175YPH9_DAUCS|nr:hypothetical protein DCAR_0832510 [Daucus carota subsp. sativus]
MDWLMCFSLYFRVQICFDSSKGTLSIRQTSSVKDIETSRAKNKKKMREIASASQMSGRSRTYDILRVELAKDAKRQNLDDGSFSTVLEFYIKFAPEDSEEPLPTDPATTASWM